MVNSDYLNDFDKGPKISQTLFINGFLLKNSNKPSNEDETWTKT